MEMKGDSTKLAELYICMLQGWDIFDRALKSFDVGSILNIKISSSTNQIHS